MEYNADKREIRLDRKLSKLDELVVKFINIVEKHADYVIMSGYVSILLVRSRATEDVDLFIRKISFEKFSEMYSDLKKNGFWCLNAEKPEDIYSFLKDDFLKAEKDIEDALHIEEVFKDKLNYGKINKLQEAIKNIGD